jgi:hypothetical protein
MELVYNSGEELALRAYLEAYLDIETMGLSFQNCQTEGGGAQATD